MSDSWTKAWVERLRHEARARGGLRLGPGLPEALRTALAELASEQASALLSGAEALSPDGAVRLEGGAPSEATAAELLVAASWLDEAGCCRLREELPEAAGAGPRTRWWFSERAVLRLGEREGEGEGPAAVVVELAPGLSARELQHSCPVRLWAGPELAPMRGAEP